MTKFPRKQPLNDAMIAKFEQAGGVSLSAQLRRDLQAAVEKYVRFCRICQEDSDLGPIRRNQLDELIKNLDGTICALEASDKIWSLGFWVVGIDLEKEAARLKLVRKHCLDERMNLAKTGPKSNPHLIKLLGALESLFLEAGGHSTKVYRPEARTSPFLNFAWAVLAQVPVSMRPNSIDALAMKLKREASKEMQRKRKREAGNYLGRFVPRPRQRH